MYRDMMTFYYKHFEFLDISVNNIMSKPFHFYSGYIDSVKFIAVVTFAAMDGTDSLERKVQIQKYLVSSY